MTHQVEFKPGDHVLDLTFDPHYEGVIISKDEKRQGSYYCVELADGRRVSIARRNLKSMVE